MNYMDPEDWYHSDAIEITVNGVRVAWTVDNEVFTQVRSLEERTHPDDDGFDLFGYLEWEDVEGDPLDDSGHNQERLRQYVINKMQESKT